MISRQSGVVDRARYLDVGELAEIHRVAETEPVPRARADLLAAEEDLSLPAEAFPADPAMALLTGALGAQLSTDNRVWRGDPVPGLRGLERLLLAHALAQEPAGRSPCLQAIRVVELAVLWRLRWQQMRRSDVEVNLTPQQEVSDEETSPA